MSEQKPLYNPTALVATVDDLAKRRRISRLASDEVGIALERICDFYEAELAKLRTALAEREQWEPVEDGKVEGCEYIFPERTDYQLVISATGAMIAIVNTNVRGTTAMMVPDDIRLCRRKSPG